MLYFAIFSYRENNEVAGHAVGSAAREPIEQGVGACHAVSNRKYQDLPTLVQKINDHFFIALALKNISAARVSIKHVVKIKISYMLTQAGLNLSV